jgi:hypothetical protein
MGTCAHSALCNETQKSLFDLHFKLVGFELHNDVPSSVLCLKDLNVCKRML